MYKNCLLRDPPTSKTMLMKKRNPIYLLLFFHNGNQKDEIEFRYDYLITNASNDIYYRILLKTLLNSNTFQTEKGWIQSVAKNQVLSKFVQRINLSFSKQVYAINFVMIIWLKTTLTGQLKKLCILLTYKMNSLL